MLKKRSEKTLKHKPGVAVAIVYRKKVLLLRRHNIPFISNPGIWSLLTGGIEKNEAPLDTAYREVFEETRIDKKRLSLLRGPLEAILTDAVRKKGRWLNAFYVFRSSTHAVKLSLENSAYRWADISELENERRYTNIFMNANEIMKALKSAIDE